MSRRRLQRLRSAVLSAAVILVLPISAAVASTPDPDYLLNNGALRFGLLDDVSLSGLAGPTATRESVNTGGLLDTPYYYSATPDRWYQLTFSERALDMAVGAGRCVGDLIPTPTGGVNFEDLPAGKCFWHRNTALASSNGYDVFPYYNAGSSSGSEGLGVRGGLASFARSSAVSGGVGSITTGGDFRLVPPPDATAFPDRTEYSFSVSHTYELREDVSYLRATTRITNTTESSGVPSAAPNVNIWVGTRDDYIGSTDRPVKARGNLTSTGFTRLASGSDASNAIQVTSGSEGVLFYSTTEGVDTVFADCCGFYDELLPIPPASSGNNEASACVESGVLDPISCFDKTFDGSYGIVLPAGDMAAGETRTIVWYYAAGPVAALTQVAQQVQQVAAVEDGGGSPVVDDVSGPVSVAVEQAAALEGTESVLVRGSVPVPVTTTISRDAGPRGGLVIEDESTGLSVTVTTSAGVSETAGVVVPESGEVVCEICARLAAGSVVEAWIYSEPRLTAAVRVEVDAEEGTCPFLRIPTGTPLDGGGAIEAGAHTLQLRMYTDNGLEVLAFPITVGAPVPTGVPSGEGPAVPGGLLAGVAGLAAVAGLAGLRRRTAAAGAVITG